MNLSAWPQYKDTEKKGKKSSFGASVSCKKDERFFFTTLVTK